MNTKSIKCKEKYLNIVYGMDKMDAMESGLTRNLADFFQKANERAAPILEYLGGKAQEVYQNSFIQNYSTKAVDIAQAVARSLSGLWLQDTIQPLLDIDKIQEAPDVMKRFILAMPRLRTLYRQQQAVGYSEHYVDGDNTKAVGEEHYTYRRVMDGLAVENEDGEYICTSYLDEILQPDDELTIQQQVDILATWDTIDIILDSDTMEDPTNPGQTL